jgi:hypothetical protein
MTPAQTNQDDNLKRYIRETLYFDLGKPTKPFIKLRGKDADHVYEFEPETVDLFGWILFYSRILVHRDANGTISGYGWYCAGWAVSEELRHVFAEAGVERTFFLTWSSDQRIFSRTVRGPAVDVNKTAFNCDFSIRYQSTLPDWRKLDDGMKHLGILVKLKVS